MERLRVAAHLNAVTVGELARAGRETFVGHLLENLFVNANGIVRRKLATVNFFYFALLDHLLCSGQVAGINRIS